MIGGVVVSTIGAAVLGLVVGAAVVGVVEAIVLGATVVGSGHGKASSTASSTFSKVGLKLANLLSSLSVKSMQSANFSPIFASTNLLFSLFNFLISSTNSKVPSS